MSFKVYPVEDIDIKCDDYTVRINGETVALNCARVSAMPFNRRWPGHQRQIEQSELISFLSLATDEPLEIEIVPKVAFENVKIRPYSLGITPEVKDGIIRFTLTKPAYFTVEPYGRNHALHIFADPLPTYTIDKQAPEVLYFGAGKHDVGMLTLKSNQTLFIDEGAVVYGCIRATDAKNIKILGRGILDNSKNVEKILFESNVEGNDEAVSNAKREHTVELHYCEGVTIDGITIRDSLVYNIRPIACDGLHISNVKIIGAWRYNSDGIDMHNCRNVHISDCFIRTFDDAVCVKGFDCFYEGDIEEAVRDVMYRGGKAYDVFCDVVVENCVIWNDWGKGLEIGAETKAEEIYNITFQNCDIIHTLGPALDCMNVDYADVHDITFRNIRIECDEIIPPLTIQGSDSEVYRIDREDFMSPIIEVEVVYHHEYSRGSASRRGKNHDFLFENIHIIGDKKPTVSIVGYDEEHKTENITIRNLTQNGTALTSTDALHWNVGAFAENIRLAGDPYAELGKNTVDAANQLASTALVRFLNPEADGVRILLVGNSITLHGILPKIGWYRSCGMAASSAEHDYVHLIEKMACNAVPNASVGICQVAEWERLYKEGEKTLPLYAAARAFGADIIVLRFVENCPKDNIDGETFLRELDALTRYLDPKGTAKFIFTTGFWRHPLDAFLRKAASEMHCPCIELGDLGDDPAMKAIGLFDHSGVANHPGDLGMQRIAERIGALLLPMLDK